MTLEDYKDKFVAFIDILGFKNIVDSIESKSSTHETDFKKVISVLNFLNEETIESNGQHDLPIYERTEDGYIEKELGNPILTYVSDCLVISTDGNFDGFKSLCNKLTKFYTDLSTDGIFLRGAITYGKVFHTGRLLFGTGYQNAYKLESTVANTPRIIIDKTATDFLYTYEGQFPLNIAGLKQDKNSTKYLRLFPFNYYPYYTGSWLDYLLRVKSNLLYQLNKFDPRVSGFGTELRELDKFCCWKEQYTYNLDFTGGHEKILQKYIWVAEEFNECLETYAEFLSDKNGKLRISKIVFDGNVWRPEEKLGHIR